MSNNILLSKVLCIDIETVPQFPALENASGEMQKLWNRKAEFLKRSETDTPDSLYERAGIYAEFGKIICIAAGYLSSENNSRCFRIHSFAGDDEEEVLYNFSSMLSKAGSDVILCAHNGKEFDFPYLTRRMIINSIPVPKILQLAGKKPWEVPHLDTMELWKFGDYKHYTPLNLLAHVLGIESPKDDIDGSQVCNVYWNERDLKRIETYCKKDTVTVMQILLRMKGEELLSKSEIVEEDERISSSKI